MPVVVLRQVLGSMVQKTGLFRSCSSSKVVDIPFVPQKLVPMVQTVLQTTEIPQVLVDKVVDFSVVQVGRVPQVQAVMKQPCSHSCSSLKNSLLGQRR